MNADERGFGIEQGNEGQGNDGQRNENAITTTLKVSKKLARRLPEFARATPGTTPSICIHFEWSEAS